MCVAWPTVALVTQTPRQDCSPLRTREIGHCKYQCMHIYLFTCTTFKVSELSFLLIHYWLVINPANLRENPLPSPPTGSNIPNCSRTLMKRPITTSTAIISKPSRLNILGYHCLSLPSTAPPSQVRSDLDTRLVQLRPTRAVYSILTQLGLSPTFLLLSTSIQFILTFDWWSKNSVNYNKKKK